MYVGKKWRKDNGKYDQTISQSYNHFWAENSEIFIERRIKWERIMVRYTKIAIF